jgi:hypothetical protein
MQPPGTSGTRLCEHAASGRLGPCKVLGSACASRRPSSSAPVLCIFAEFLLNLRPSAQNLSDASPELLIVTKSIPLNRLFTVLPKVEGDVGQPEGARRSISFGLRKSGYRTKRWSHDGQSSAVSSVQYTCVAVTDPSLLTFSYLELRPFADWLINCPQLFGSS